MTKQIRYTIMSDLAGFITTNLETSIKYLKQSEAKEEVMTDFWRVVTDFILDDSVKVEKQSSEYLFSLVEI